MLIMCHTSFIISIYVKAMRQSEVICLIDSASCKLIGQQYHWKELGFKSDIVVGEENQSVGVTG